MFLIVILLRRQPGACAMGARKLRQSKGPTQNAQNARPKGPSRRPAAARFLLQRSMEGAGGGAGGRVTVTGTDHKQFLLKNFSEIFFEKLPKRPASINVRV